MFETIITDFFMWCVYILQVIGGSPGEYGFGYYLANIFIFVIFQPALIILFFINYTIHSLFISWKFNWLLSLWKFRTTTEFNTQSNWYLN